MHPIKLEKYNEVVVLTGPGVSAPSGLPVGEQVTDWRKLRKIALKAQPNAAHFALAAMERRITGRGGAFTLVTLNVDGLHQKAGSLNVVELRGSMFRYRCQAECGWSSPEPAQLCTLCGSGARMDLVLAGESFRGEAEYRAKRALRDCDLYLAVGVNHEEVPASTYSRSAEFVGARVISLSLEERRGGEHYQGPPELLLPKLLGSLAPPSYLAACDVADFKTRAELLGPARAARDTEDFLALASSLGLEILSHGENSWILLTGSLSLLDKLVHSYSDEENATFGVLTVVRRRLRCVYEKSPPLPERIQVLRELVHNAPVGQVCKAEDCPQERERWSALIGSAAQP